MLPGFSIERTTKTTYRGTFTGWWILRAGEPILTAEPFDTLKEAMEHVCFGEIKCYWCRFTKDDAELCSLIPCCDGDQS